MRTRRFLALLLTLALLMGAACAESGLRPRRDGGPATEMTQPTGAPLSRQRWTGAFTLDRNGRAQTWQLDISYGEYEDGMLLQASATPESGEGVALRAALQHTFETVLAISSMSADARVEIGSLQVLDAASGKASAEYALCVGPEGLTVLDGADNELLSWSFSQSPFFNVLWYDPDYSALEARFDALSEGKEIFVSLRELVLPLAQGAYRADMGEIKLHLPEETFEAAGTLLAELKGGVRLTPTDDGLRFAYYSEGSPELSRHRLEGELTDDGGEFTLLTRENAALSPSVTPSSTSATASTFTRRTTCAAASSVWTRVRWKATMKRASAPHSPSTRRVMATSPISSSIAPSAPRMPRGRPRCASMPAATP